MFVYFINVENFDIFVEELAVVVFVSLISVLESCDVIDDDDVYLNVRNNYLPC